MTGDEPKWLHGVVRSSDPAGFKLRKAICMYEVAQVQWLRAKNEWMYAIRSS
jgi:hypothetical protein